MAMRPIPRTHEHNLIAQGYARIAGADEAGRGALAGPLVAAAVIMPLAIDIPRVQDSKKLEEDVREELYEEIITHAEAWGVAIVSERIIDERGIQFANLSALAEAVTRLDHAPDYVLVDGFRITVPFPSQAIIHGDREIFPIACASIIAKVTRDRIMREHGTGDPRYAFATHKGYGTRQHRKEIHIHGLSDFHRKSFHLKKWR